MSHLQIFQATGSHQPVPHFASNDPALISAELAQRGIGFERWPARVELPAGADAAAVLTAYATEIKRVQSMGNYPTVDAIRMTPEHPDREVLRQKFLAEHTHSEDEVRFFVEGHGLFCLHIDNEVLQVLCEADDWISVPAGTKHWFDMGSTPKFCAIRFFNNPDGWVAHFTGSKISDSLPTLE